MSLFSQMEKADFLTTRLNYYIPADTGRLSRLVYVYLVGNTVDIFSHNGATLCLCVLKFDVSHMTIICDYLGIKKLKCP